MSYVLGAVPLVDVKKLGAGLDREQAYAVFQFGPDQGKSPEERGRRFRAWDVTPAWLAAFEAARLITFVDGKPLVTIAKENLSVKQRRTVANAVKAQFDQAWASQFGSSGGGGGGGGDSTLPEEKDNTPLLIAGAAGVALVAFVAMRRRK